ncbi:MAG: hypothetical protein WC107_06240 [Patescibacteria group bacterium]
MTPDQLQIEADSAAVELLTAVGTLAGVVVLLAGGKNGPGVGAILAGDGTLAWRAPGSATFGAEVTVAVDGTYSIADGEDPDKVLQVQVYVNYLPAAGTTAEVFLADRYNNAIAQDDATAAEAAAGDVLDYQLELVNTSQDLASSFRVWLDASADSRTSISLDGVTYSAPASEATGLQVIAIAPGQSATLYVRRTIAAGDASTPKQPVRIHCAFDSF